MTRYEHKGQVIACKKDGTLTVKETKSGVFVKAIVPAWYMKQIKKIIKKVEGDIEYQSIN